MLYDLEAFQFVKFDKTGPRLGAQLVEYLARSLVGRREIIL
jgi:hypothetical protein